MVERSKRSIHIAIYILLLIHSKSQPDDDPIEYKGYKIVFDCYLFIPLFYSSTQRNA